MTAPALTSGREVLAYAVAQIVKTAAVYQFGAVVIGPLIELLGAPEGFLPVLLTTLVLSLFWACLVLILFLPLRSLIGAAPAMVVGAAGGQAIATSKAEAAAFFLAAMAQSLIGWAGNLVIAPALYRPLFEAGKGDLVMPASLAILAVNMAVCFGIFVWLRRMFCRR